MKVIRISKYSLSLLFVFLLAGAVFQAPPAYGQERDYPQIAHDPLNNQYLVVYRTLSPGGVSGRMIGNDGIPLDAEFVIAANESRPDVAYDSVNGQYLVVWYYGGGIYGQFVDIEGSLSGSTFTIAAPPGSWEMRDAAVAFDPVNQQYLVAWEDDRNFEYSYYTREIYGQRVNSDGTMLGGEIPISTAIRGIDGIDIAFDNAHQVFMVAWEDYRNDPSTSIDIYAQMVRSNGTLIGNASVNMAIDTSDSYQREAKVTNDSTNHLFLVSYTNRTGGQDDWDIYGKLVNPTSGVPGPAIQISTMPGMEYYHTTTFSPLKGQFLVAYNHAAGASYSAEKLYGQWVSSTYGVQGAPYTLTTGGSEDTLPDAAYNSLCGNILIAYAAYENAAYDIGLALFGNACPRIIVNTPNGGEEIDAGSTYRIRWTAPSTAASFKVLLSTNNRNSWTRLAGQHPYTFLDWTVPSVSANKNKCYVKVIALKANGKMLGTDQSDRPFTIQVVDFNWPIAGSTAQSGDSVTISWSVKDPDIIAPAAYAANEVTMVIVYYTLNGGKKWKSILTIPVNPGDPLPESCPWTIPYSVAPQKRSQILVIMKNAGGRVVAKATSKYFTLASVLLTAPDGGEVLESGGTYDIVWNSVAEADQFRLIYSVNNGLKWKLIEDGVTGSPYTWYVPAQKNNMKKCLVKVTGKNSLSGELVGWDKSDRKFTIEVVKLTSPNGGEIWTGGSAQDITMKINETIREIDKVLLYYTVNRGSTWKLIDTIDLNPGDPAPDTYAWDPIPAPGVDKPKSKVKIILKDDAGKIIGSDASNQWFEITGP